MIRTTLKTIASCAVIATAATAVAQAQTTNKEDTGLYLQGGYSYLDIKPDGASDGIDTNAITARLGYQFSPVFSLEGELSSGFDDGEFDYNVDEDQFDFDDNNDGDFNDIIAASGDVGLNYLVAGYARASLPITDRIDISARAGYAYIDLDASVITTPGGNTVNIEDSESGLTGGVGATFDITESWELRADYTFFAFDDTDTQAGTLVAGYKF